MKRRFWLAGLAVAGLLLVFPVGRAVAGTVRLKVTPSMIPDEQPPRIYGNAPSGWGPDSWQGPVEGNGNKTNYNVRYYSSSNLWEKSSEHALNDLFGNDVAASLTIGDIASISYWTKGNPDNEDWYIQIYTRPTGTNDAKPWYHSKYTNNYTHAAQSDWMQYTTDSGTSTGTTTYGMTFNGDSLSDLANVNGSDLIEMISVGTMSGWNGFDGYMDGLTITLKDEGFSSLFQGQVGQVDFAAPLPRSALMGIGLLGLLGAFSFVRRRRLSAMHS